MASPAYRLVMDTKGSGIVSCSKCGDKYDLNNGGLIVEGKEGDKGHCSHPGPHRKCDLFEQPDSLPSSQQYRCGSTNQLLESRYNTA